MPITIFPQTMLKHIPTPRPKAPAIPTRTVRTVFLSTRIGALNSEIRCSMFLTSSREKHLICSQNQVL